MVIHPFLWSYSKDTYLNINGLISFPAYGKYKHTLLISNIHSESYDMIFSMNNSSLRCKSRNQETRETRFCQTFVTAKGNVRGLSMKQVLRDNAFTENGSPWEVMAKQLLSPAQLSVAGDICLMHHQFQCFSIDQKELRIHLGKSTWNLRMEVWKMISFSIGWFFWFHVIFQGVSWLTGNLLYFFSLLGSPKWQQTEVWGDH